MRKILQSFGLLLLAASLFGLQGCLKDSCRNTYTLYTPVMKRLTDIRSEIGSGPAKTMKKTGKLFVFGNYIFLNELNEGIHVIDNTNPATPRNIGFIRIPGNVDIAAKGSYLYADCYSDIVVLDISNPLSVTPVRFMDNVLKENRSYWGNATSAADVEIPVDWAKRDTVVDCETYMRWSNCAMCAVNDMGGPVMTGTASGPTTGTAGSMASLVVVNNFLYGVSSASLYAIDITTPAQPSLSNKVSMTWGIETIYPFGNKLFIGSNTGMFIYSIANPAQPVLEGQFSHARSCDPVITDGQYAYVTLRTGNTCAGTTNQMDVLNVSNVNAPTMVKTYTMTNPRGLSKDGDLLLVCDGASGLKLYNATDPANLQLLKTAQGLETYDVITQNGRAIVVATDGLYQYTYTSSGTLQLLSKLSIQN